MSSSILNALVRSMRSFGPLQPIIMDDHGDIIDGHLRNEACRLAGVEPWRVTRTGLTKEARLQFMIRRDMDPLEMADLAALLRQQTNPSCAQRAHGSGTTQKVIAHQIAEQFGRDVSPRETSYALALARASADEREAVARAAPTSMRAAHRALNHHRRGGDASQSTPDPETRTELLKCANELRAAVIRHRATISDADRVVLIELRAAINRILEQGDTHATP